jgi:CMP-N-acetylneuraminic acid synthetase
VSTDDAEIASIANAWGAETPFVRPAELANDFTATVPVVAHAIQACEALGWSFDNVCCIYPGVPFIEVEDLQGAFKHLEVGSDDYCFPVTEFPSAIQRALKRNSDGVMQPFYPEFQLTRTQDLEPAYFDAGQFYWANKRAWLSNSRIHSSGIGYLIPSWRVVDIDTPEDWERAENLAMAIQSR